MMKGWALLSNTLFSAMVCSTFIRMMRGKGDGGGEVVMVSMETMKSVTVVSLSWLLPKKKKQKDNVIFTTIALLFLLWLYLALYILTSPRLTITSLRKIFIAYSF